MARYHEDFPCCGCEPGDCYGDLYGSDEDIKARVLEDIKNGHGDCDHESGLYNCDTYDDECDDEDHECDSCEPTDTGWACSYCERPCPEGAHAGVAV